MIDIEHTSGQLMAIRSPGDWFRLVSGLLGEARRPFSDLCSEEQGQTARSLCLAQWDAQLRNEADAVSGD